MRRTVLFSVVAAIVLTVAVVAGAAFLFHDSGMNYDATDAGSSGATAAQDSGTTGADGPGEGGENGKQSEDSTPTEDIPDRPACPVGPIAGVDLDCLGGQSGGGSPKSADARADSGITVANVWAWWCEPCRAELPAMAEVARSHPEWTVVGVHADPKAAAGASLLDDLGVDLPSYQDSDNAFASKLSLPRVVPITVVIVDGEVQKVIAKPFDSATEIATAVDDALAA